jgi:hypothetical protein
VISQAVNVWRRLDGGHHGLALDVGLYAFSAIFAGLTAATSTLAPHRAWAAIALWGYGAAALTTALIMSLLAGAPGVPANKLMIDRLRAALTGLTWVAVALLPLVVEAVQRAGGRIDRAQEEVVVTEMAGQRLLETGTPYLGRATIAALPEPDWLFAYVPYQTGMAAFGLPRAVFGDGWWTDARVWFALATAAALAGAVALLSFEPPLIRAVQAATVLPICALTLATGGDDLPVLALCLLALALVARGRFGAAGLAVGAAGAMKLFAWPVLAVLAVVALRRGAGPRFVAGAIGLPVLALLPAVLVDPGAAVENVVRFPLGRGLVTSPAQSPFPGHLIATGLPGGRAIAAVLLVAAGVAFAVGLIRRPPGTAASGALWSGYGLLVAILLMPSTRFGYLLYPIAFLVWTPPLRETSWSSSWRRSRSGGGSAQRSEMA